MRPVRFKNKHQDVLVTSDLALAAADGTLEAIKSEEARSRAPRALASDLKELVDHLNRFLTRWLPKASLTRAEYVAIEKQYWDAVLATPQRTPPMNLSADRARLIWMERERWAPRPAPKALRQEVVREAVQSLREILQQKLEDLQSRWRVPLLRLRGRPRIHPEVVEQIDLMFALGLSDKRIFTKLKGFGDLVPSSPAGVRQLRRRHMKKQRER